MPEEKLRPTYTFTEDRLTELRAIVPEAFADGELNWHTLRDLLAPHLAEDGPDAEHFGLSWPGKREARRLAAKPSGNTLRPAPGQGVNEETTHNLYLEGDNLEVLKLLQKSYAGQVKMIYIDPPYNTGNDFVYKDNFTEPSEDYLRRTGQVGDGGELLTSNPKTSGRFHTNWLNMIYPRLRLARTLLRDDGMVFVSIDDNEVDNLREVMDEVFGAENFNCEIIIRANSRGQTYKQIAKTHEYLIIYSRETDAELLELEKLAEQNDLDFTDAIGSFSIRELRNRNPKFGKHNRPNLFYPIFVDITTKDREGFYPVRLHGEDNYTIEIEPFNSQGKESCWRWGKVLFGKNVGNDTLHSNVVAKKKQDGSYGIYEKYRKTTFKPKSIWDENNFLTETGTVQLKKLDLSDAFPFPKPVDLVKRCLLLSTIEDDVVLDFFSGSATTAQAVLETNREDGGSRQFILTQLPEPTPADSAARKAGYTTITEIGEERIRRVISQMQEKPSLELRETPEDLGFKVLTLSPSNFRAWRDYTGDSVDELQRQFDLFEKSPLADGWTPDGLLTEVMLLEGFPLDSTVTPQPQWKHNAVSCITSPACGHRLWTCFDDTLHTDTVSRLTLTAEDVFICRDSALDDNAKLRLSQTGTLKTI